MSDEVAVSEIADALDACQRFIVGLLTGGVFDGSPALEPAHRVVDAARDVLQRIAAQETDPE